MPALINIAANAILGASMAVAAKNSVALRQALNAWPLLFLLGFEALVFTPVATYLFRFYPQWSMLYLFDPQIFTELNRWIGLLSALAIILNFGALLGGYALARFGIVTNRNWISWATFGIAALTIGYVFLSFGERVVFIGDYDAFWSGQAVLLFKMLPGWLGSAMYLGGFLFIVWIHNRFGHRDPSWL